MTTNAIPRSVQQNGFETLNSQIKPVGTEDHFSFPNRGTYYFKHPDTDSDMDKIKKTSSTHESAQETSDDEWEYTKNEEKKVEDMEINEDLGSLKKSIPDETIKRLVQKAEELVSPDQSKKLGRIPTFSKMSRVEQWLKNKKPEDSCDASGEDEERESQLSEDFDESTTTFKANQDNDSHNTSFTELKSSESTPKVLMRQRKFNGNRPWSVSGIPQVETNNGIDEFSHSTSESALHNIGPKKINDFHNAASTQTMALAGNNSTSSTIEDSNTILPEGKISPSRRRKLKLKKKLHYQYKPDKRCLTNRLSKSSSYSGCSASMNHHIERQTSSDPQSMSLLSFGRYDTTSGADTDDSIGRRIPKFKVGLKTNYLNPDIRDSSPGKSSLNTAEEQSSSLSEQAWDSYQEKYLSEAYSEAHDSDAARRLLEFGEDYHKFIDSQSDWSTNPDFSPTFRRRNSPFRSYYVEDCDADSNTESLRKIINASKEKLDFTKEIHEQQLQMGLGQYLDSNNINDMLLTCERHIKMLEHIDDHSDESISRDKRTAKGYLEEWKELKESISIMQEYRNLQKRILQLKKALSSIVVPEDDSILGAVDDLEKEVCKYQKLLVDNQEHRKELNDLNIDAHHFVHKNKLNKTSSLRDDIKDLYYLCENIHQKASDRLQQLQPLLEKWKNVEKRLDQLHRDLRNDEKTLQLLDSALTGGTFPEQTANYVRNVAKLLLENDTGKGCTIQDIFTEGSWSDSGISDEGSEHDRGERERRLAALKLLVRQLEAVLSPDSNARAHMANRVNLTEKELKERRKQCKALFVRSASCSLPLVSSSVGEKNDIELKEAKGKDGGGDPDHDSGITSWFRRAVRASVPFQLVLVTIMCIAWLLEPQCCDNMNNYAWSLSPKLRYINGPPPI